MMASSNYQSIVGDGSDRTTGTLISRKWSLTLLATTIAVAVIVSIIVVPSVLPFRVAGKSRPRLAFSQQRVYPNGTEASLFFAPFDENVNNTDAVYAFHVLQIADIHLGENSWTDWGPEQDRKTWIALDRLISAEGPDLIILSGDQLTANNVDTNATVYYQQLGAFLQRYGIPWAVVFGNHDDAPYEYYANDYYHEHDEQHVDGTIQYSAAKTSRRQLVETMNAFDLSLTQAGPEDLPGVSNYWLDILNPQPTYRSNSDDDMTDTASSSSPSSSLVVGARILLLDSGGGSIPEEIMQSHIDWFHSTNQQQNAAPYEDITFSEPPPVLAFQHIPTTLRDFRFNGSICHGENGDGGLAPVKHFDAGLVRALSAAGNVQVLAVGHNHGNDYCCPTNSAHDDCNNRSSNSSVGAAAAMHVCFGRHSGYGGYGKWDRGARVYRLELNADSGQFAWKSWVRLESGEILNAYRYPAV